MRHGIEVEDTYIGDGVFASFDGYHIVLDVRAQDDHTRIALEPAVLDNLNRFRETANAALEEVRRLDKKADGVAADIERGAG